MFWERMPFAACGLGLFLTGPAVAQTIFTEVTKEALPAISKPTRQATGDYDNDGWPDLYAVESLGVGNKMVLLHNEGNGRFADRSTVLQSDTAPAKTKGGGVFGDYDNDGDLDLFVPVGAWREGAGDADILLRNDRGLLREVTLGTGLEVEKVNTDNALWLDYDRDGHLDLYLGHFWTSRYSDEQELSWSFLAGVGFSRGAAPVVPSPLRPAPRWQTTPLPADTRRAGCASL